MSAKARTALRRLRKVQGPRYAFLRHETPFQLLVAVMLSAQTADAYVNKVTPALFAKYPTPEAMARARVDGIRRLIGGVQYAWTKAPRLKETALLIVERHGGEVPRSLDDLTALPGVGRKTASVVQGYVWGEAETPAVDTHVKRVSYRLGLTTSESIPIAERELSRTFPRKDWPDVNFHFIAHGRSTCHAIRPACGRCVLLDLCLQRGVTEVAAPATAKSESARA